MANALKDAVAEKITVTDEYETTERKGFNYWLIIPVAVLTVATGGFFVVRRLLSSTVK